MKEKAKKLERIPQDERLALRVESGLKDELDRIAYERRLPLSAVIREALWRRVGELESRLKK